MNILYVHHGNRKVSNPPTQDDDLTEIGYKDCEIVSQLLKSLDNKLNYKAIYTSPYFRCKKSAEIINKYLNIPIYDEPRFNEFSNEPSLKKKESWIDCQMRIREAIRDIVNKYDEKDTVICLTSGVNLTAFISLAYKIKPSNDLPFPVVTTCSPIVFKINKESFDN
ncbi:MAG: histidine phosphatase family protein [Clostridia bacterium]|nr:histidine phosphatase family protein [Clostridia bacterium]